MKAVDNKRTRADARPRAAGSGTEVLADAILLFFKFMEPHLIGAERRFYEDLKTGEYVPLEHLLPFWDSLTERFPSEMKLSIKGMVYRWPQASPVANCPEESVIGETNYRMKRILIERGIHTPADALRASNVIYQTFVRGPQIGGIEVVTPSENEAVLEDSTWIGCVVGNWFGEAFLRAFGAHAVRIEHLKPCQRKGDRLCRVRLRWSSCETDRCV